MPSSNGIREHFAALGLNDDATAEEVKQAYRDLAKIWHPDKFSENDIRLRKEAEDKFKEINVAYGCIQEAQSSHSRETDTAIERTPLPEAVRETQVFIIMVTVKISTLRITMFPGFKSPEEIGAAIQECSVLCKEGVSRLKSVIRRIKHEAPEYPKKELERSLAELAELQAELEDNLAATMPNDSATLKCISCNGEISDEDSFCSKCGAPQTNRLSGFSLAEKVRLMLSESKNKILAIKFVREETGMGLKEAKDFVDTVIVSTASPNIAAPQYEPVESTRAYIDNRAGFVSPATSTPSFSNGTKSDASGYRPYWIAGILLFAFMVCVVVVIASKEPATEQQASSNMPSSTPVSQSAEQPVREAPAPSQPSPPPAPIDITPSSVQDPMQSKRLNANGLHMLSGANPDFASARNDFERSFQLDSTNVEALNNLGYVYGRMGDYQTAESTLLKVLDMSPTRRAALGNLGAIQAELGKTQEAADHFCQSIRQSDSLEHGKSKLSRIFKGSDANVQAAINVTLANCN